MKGVESAEGNPPLIEVLLATYNGARFLEEQIDSIFQQSYPNFRVLARDDGSSLDLTDVEAALDEILISGGRLNAKLLGIGVETDAA